MLGRMILEDGDFAGATPWFERGVRLGDYQAMQDLGVMWLKGEGRDIDLARAYAYFRLEAEIIPRSDDYYVPRPDLVRILKMPDALKARLSPQQLQDGERHFTALKDSMTCRWNEWYWKHAARTVDRIRQRKQPTN